MSQPAAHFLHIGKTGGTAVKWALREHTDRGRYRIILHPHETRLSDVPPGDRFFFFLRDPITRFVSGFYSRQRQGRPRYNAPWSPAEAEAFGRFVTANDLAEAITDPDAARRAAARKAMNTIQHVRDSVWSWFGDAAALAARHGDVMFIGFQESLEPDFRRLTYLLGLGEEVRLPDDPLGSHRNPAEVDRRLSDLARRNLLQHYRADVEFHSQCLAAAGRNEPLRCGAPHHQPHGVLAPVIGHQHLTAGDGLAVDS